MIADGGGMKELAAAFARRVDQPEWFMLQRVGEFRLNMSLEEARENRE